MRQRLILVFALMVMIILAFSISLSALAYPFSYMYRSPTPTIIIDSSITPEVLMPGDTGIVSVVIKNCADQYVISYQREDFSFTVPIYRAELFGTAEIEVTTDPYENIGIIGPDDEITIYFNVAASDNITDGTHFLNISLVSGYDEAPDEINRKIPLKVDSSDVMLIQSKSPTPTSVSLDVANPRRNTLNAVTIVPAAGMIEFSPEEYYIGTMEPDEIFTIDFDIKALTPAGDSNMSFKSRFKNGDTWHESEVCNITFRAMPDGQGNAGGDFGKGSSGIGNTAAAAVLLSATIGGAYYWWRRTKKS